MGLPGVEAMSARVHQSWPELVRISVELVQNNGLAIPCTVEWPVGLGL
jgi:hypothetical protein